MCGLDFTQTLKPYFSQNPTIEDTIIAACFASHKLPLLLSLVLLVDSQDNTLTAMSNVKKMNGKQET